MPQEINFNNVEYKGLATNVNQAPQTGLPEIVLAGRSNVGKSSLVNGLCQRKNIARISQTPGKTQAVLYFLIDHQFYLTDLPGYGYARTSKQSKSKFSNLVDNYLTADRPIKGVLHLLDIRHKPSADDRIMNHWLTEQGIPYIIVLTKADKLSRAQMHVKKMDILRELGLPQDLEVAMVSNTKKTGYELLKEQIGILLEL
ncbi:MAG: ribosome biogenesis GTP-binding protein YihA/YsxC [Fastidiosipilaceae bacterium]|jgi:GTP-binding protein|nr:YihA family ribosome biogenesis GTP-binding protein [Clostridiaceae bacterium]